MTNPEKLDKLSADGRSGAGAALVALTGGLREGERLYAVFSAGPSEGVRPIFRLTSLPARRGSGGYQRNYKSCLRMPPRSKRRRGNDAMPDSKRLSGR